MTPLTTILAELEEAERAVNAAKASVTDVSSMMHFAQVLEERDALMRTHLPTLLEALKRQREALEWYETHVRDCRKITKDGDAARHALDKDGGERARAALKEATGG